MMPDKPRIVGEEKIYSGRIVSLKRVELEMTGGKRIKREVVEHSDSIGVLPIDAQGNFIFVRQYRSPSDSYLLELPAGGVEAGETVEECLQRELSEEIGYTAGSIRKVAGFYLAPGWATEFMHGYIAMDLTAGKSPGDEDEEIELVRLTPAESLQAIGRGEIVDCKSIALIGLYFAELGAPTSRRQLDPWLDDNPDQ